MNRDLTANNSCEFCDEFAGGAANSFVTRYSDEVASRTILEKESFRVLPSLGQIVAGYLLLVPKNHHRAFADMSAPELEDAERVKAQLTAGLKSTYGDYLFFEHGARSAGSGGCGISHAHLHAVPFPNDRDPVGELTRAFRFEEVSSLVDLKRIPPERSYLYYEAVQGKRYVLYPRFVPSQYIRRLLAEALGTDDWDWRHCGKEKRFLDTLSRTSELLAEVSR